MIDVSPRGYMYGFPKELPQTAWKLKGSRPIFNKDFDVDNWLVKNGYPRSSLESKAIRTWVDNVKEQ